MLSQQLLAAVLATGAVASAVLGDRDACGEGTQKICYGLDGGESQQLDVSDVEYAGAYLRYLGQNNQGADAFWTMPPSVDCQQWTLPLPGGGTVLALAKHINPRVKSSILYEDMAKAIDGGEDASTENKAKSLRGCASNGGQIGVAANLDNPAYKTSDYINSNAKPEGVVIKLVRSPSIPKPQPSPNTFHDQFDQGIMKDWTVYDGIYDASSKALVASNVPSGKTLVRDQKFTDFTYEADITLTANSGNAGLLLRVSNAGSGPDSYNGYYAGLEANGNVVLGRVNNNWTPLSSASLSIVTGQVYHIKVQAYGDLLSVHVNDMRKPKIVVKDSTYASGLNGVRVYNTGAIFDNVDIRPVQPSPTTESFDSGTMPAGWTAYGSFDASSKALVAATADGNKFVLDRELSNFVLEADVTIGANGGNAGFVFRVSNPGNGPDAYRGYYTGLANDGSVILGSADNNWKFLTTAASGVGANRVCHMMVTAIGADIAVYVDDMQKPKITRQDSSFSSGKVGVRAYQNGAAFDNIRVISL